MKDKISNIFTSVRKAFLELDIDHDGFISVEDILRYFGIDTEFNFNDLKKLFIDKDSSKYGWLSY